MTQSKDDKFEGPSVSPSASPGPDEGSVSTEWLRISYWPHEVYYLDCGYSKDDECIKIRVDGSSDSFRMGIENARRLHRFLGERISEWEPVVDLNNHRYDDPGEGE